jgi:hypothetical protein
MRRTLCSTALCPEHVPSLSVSCTRRKPMASSKHVSRVSSSGGTCEECWGRPSDGGSPCNADYRSPCCLSEAPCNTQQRLMRGLTRCCMSGAPLAGSPAIDLAAQPLLTAGQSHCLELYRHFKSSRICNCQHNGPATPLALDMAASSSGT